MGLVTYRFSIGQGSNAWDWSIWSNKVLQCYVLTFGYEISNYFIPFSVAIRTFVGLLV